MEHKSTSVSVKNLIRRLNRRLRQMAAAVLDKTFVLRCLLNFKYRGKTIVLMYHRVLDDSDLENGVVQSGLFVRRETFERQISYVKDNFKVLSFSEFADILNNKKELAGISFLITFDDGWKDNFTNAFPVLKKHEVPALIFLAAGFIGKQSDFWQLRVTRLCNFLSEKSGPDDFFKKISAGRPHYEHILAMAENSDDQSRQDHVFMLLSELKQHPLPEIEQFIKDLCNIAGIDPACLHGTDSFLSWEEAALMKSHGIEFGSHGVTHEILTRSKPTVADELRQSKSIIENRLKIKISSFSYPNGDYDDFITDAVQNEGYETAFSTQAGASGPGTNPMAIPRINIHEDMTNTIPMFLCRIIGLW